MVEILLTQGTLLPVLHTPKDIAPYWHAAVQLKALVCLQGLARLEELARKVADMLTNRVEANLTASANTRLVDLPGDRSVTADEFVALQAKLVRSQGARLAIR